MFLVLTGVIYDYDGHLSLGLPMAEDGMDSHRFPTEEARDHQREAPRVLVRYRATGAKYEQRSLDGW